MFINKKNIKFFKKFNNKGLFNVYSELTGEENGEKTHHTYFQSRHLNEPVHLDYVYAKKD